MATSYRTLFLGVLVQDTFLNAGGTTDLFAAVDSPFCRDGDGRLTLRGSGIAGSLIATLRQLKGDVPADISGGEAARAPSVWRFFNSHPVDEPEPAFRQHVAIAAQTGAAMPGALFNIETLPPGTVWPFLLEVDTSVSEPTAALAREVLAHWVSGRCLLGGEVARGLGWMHLENLREIELTPEHADLWPCSTASDRYPEYIAEHFGPGRAVEPAKAGLRGWDEHEFSIEVGRRANDYGIDSLSIGGHATEELAASWDDRFLDKRNSAAASALFDPDFAVVTLEDEGVRLPFIPGSSLRGPLRHALERLSKMGKVDDRIVKSLFGAVQESATLLISDALPDKSIPVQFAWFQHNAADEFSGGVYESAKFDRIAVMQGRFRFKVVLERASTEEREAFAMLVELARDGQIAIGGGQWRGHGWLAWTPQATSATTADAGQ